MDDYRIESDSLGKVRVAADKLWGAQTQRAVEQFHIGSEKIPPEMVAALTLVKKASALANHRVGWLDKERLDLIVAACDEILEGRHAKQFPLRVWMTGSGTQFNMNVNEVVSNRCCQMAGTPLGSKEPVHPNDHVNLSQSTNDAFPTAMCLASARGVTERLAPALEELRGAFADKAAAWSGIVKIGRTHMQDAVPLTLGQELSGHAAMLDDGLGRIKNALPGVCRLALGGTAVGTGVNTAPGFAGASAAILAELTGLPLVSAPNKFAIQGAHDDLVFLSAALKSLAVSLLKIADDIRFLSCGPRCGIAELKLPENEPGSSFMPGKINPTQCEALAMIAMQVMANDTAVALAGASGTLEMNAAKPLMIHALIQSLNLLSDGCRNFRIYLVEGMRADEKRIGDYVRNSLMLATALVPRIGYDKAAQVAQYAHENDLTLKEAAIGLKAVTEEEFDRLVDARKMVGRTG